jgi:hypothetical protein
MMELAISLGIWTVVAAVFEGCYLLVRFTGMSKLSFFIYYWACVTVLWVMCVNPENTILSPKQVAPMAVVWVMHLMLSVKSQQES